MAVKRNALSGALVPVAGPDGGVVWQSWTYGELLQHLTNDLDLSDNSTLPQLTGLIKAPDTSYKTIVLWWGSVAGGGTINLAGSGFWVPSRSAVGTYSLTFSRGPASGSMVMVHQQQSAGVSAALSSGTGSTSSAGVGVINVTTYNAGVPADLFFSFVAIAWA